MKKIISLILAVGIVVSFAACGKKNDEELPTEIETNVEVMEEETEEILDNEDVVENEEVKNEEVKNEEVKNEEVKDETVEEDKKEENIEVKDEEVKNEEAEEEKAETESTLGNTILALFKEKAKEGMTIEEIANAISQMEEIKFNCMSAPVEPGFLAGFNEEITNFKSGVTFAPMIGSIPFVGYVFEAEDADALIATLKTNANLRWNICVEAEEMVSGKVGNKVFFVMCPKSLED